MTDEATLEGSLADYDAHVTAIEQHVSILFACSECDFDAEFASIDAFTDSEIWRGSNADALGGFEGPEQTQYASSLANGEFRVKCPECEHERAGMGLTAEAESVVLTGNDALFTPSAILVSNGGIETLSDQPTPTVAVCSECETPLDEAAFHEGPGAPEVGWEYYECPECGHQMSPETLT